MSTAERHPPEIDTARSTVVGSPHWSCHRKWPLFCHCLLRSWTVLRSAGINWNGILPAFPLRRSTVWGNAHFELSEEKNSIAPKQLQIFNWASKSKWNKLMPPRLYGALYHFFFYISKITFIDGAESLRMSLSFVELVLSSSVGPGDHTNSSGVVATPLPGWASLSNHVTLFL